MQGEISITALFTAGAETLQIDPKTTEFFATEVVDRFTSDVTIQFLRALQDEFGEKLHVLLDNASYFTSQQVRDFIVVDSLVKQPLFGWGMQHDTF